MNITQKYDHHININVTYITFIATHSWTRSQGVTFRCNSKYILISQIVFFFRPKTVTLPISLIFLTFQKLCMKFGNLSAYFILYSVFGCEDNSRSSFPPSFTIFKSYQLTFQMKTCCKIARPVLALLLHCLRFNSNFIF